jgi:uncharacterized protein involved in exopolysaccharide biosynthesis
VVITAGARGREWGNTVDIDLNAWLAEAAAAWRVIAAASVAAFAAAWLIGSFAMTHWYRATAIVRPSTPPTMQNRLLGMIGSAPGSTMLAGLGSPQATEAQEYVTILESFSFTTALVRKHQLARELLSRAEMNGEDYANSLDLQWAAHDAMRERFEAEYSAKTGNLTLTYSDTDPGRAQRVLGYYVDGLRDKLRQREINDSSAAVASLQEEVRATSDALLAQNLYELMAKQLQRKKLAQVQADFAFTVLEPPIAPRKPYYPRALFTATVAAAFAALGAAAIVIIRSRRCVAVAPQAAVEPLHGPDAWS